MAELWFKYLIENKCYWVVGFTTIRMNKIKDKVLSDRYIMFDLLERHNGRKFTPEQLKNNDRFMFNHCIQNLASSTFDKMVEHGIIKL